MKRILLGLCFAAAISGCSARLDFNSLSPLGDGVAGKYWHEPYFADLPLYNPISYNPSYLVSTFDAAGSGSFVQLVATLQDPNQTFHKGYARLYLDGIGWAPVGPLFGPVATDGTVDLGVATVAAGSSGLFMANFFAAGTAGRSVSASFTGQSWQTYPANTATTAIPDWDPTLDMIAGPRAVSVMDALGRGFVFLTDQTGTGRVRAGFWQSANPAGLNPALNDASGADISPGSGITARYDGVSKVCVTYELDAADELKATCEDITSSAAFDFDPFVESTTISSAPMAGHESATDGGGGIMTVFYQLDGGDYHAFASLAADGEWPAIPTRIDEAMPSNYVAPSPLGGTAPLPGARPGVAYVGRGRYVAVWVGVSPDTEPATTALFTSVYQNGTWSPAEMISGTEEPYLLVPHPQALHVFGNGDENAGFALNKIFTDQIIPVPVPAPTSFYPEFKEVRVTQVARWHSDHGWLPVKNLGNLCYNFGTAGNFPASVGRGDDATCSHRPTGVILPSGNTLVFFQDRDDNAGLASAGNRRVAVGEFSP